MVSLRISRLHEKTSSAWTRAGISVTSLRNDTTNVATPIHHGGGAHRHQNQTLGGVEGAAAIAAIGVSQSLRTTVAHVQDLEIEATITAVAHRGTRGEEKMTVGRDMMIEDLINPGCPQGRMDGTQHRMYRMGMGQEVHIGVRRATLVTASIP